MNKIKIYLILIFSVFVFSSCNDWLNVTPQGDAKADDLLTTTSGYNSALAGVYYKLIQSDMYASDLSFSALDALAQYWNILESNHSLYYFTQYDYENIEAKYKINAWWKNFYIGIAQCNQILETLEKNGKSIDTPELFEGELLALRAFMHLQLYRLFGTVVQNDIDLDKKAISYRTKYDDVATEFLTCREVLNKAKKDLKKALKLLDKDPIRTGSQKSDFDVSRNIRINRTVRMNYFGILGLLSRVEQLLLNQSEVDGAFYWANRLVEEAEASGYFSLADRAKVANSDEKLRDLMYSSEIICSFHVDNIYKTAGSTFKLPGYREIEKQLIQISEVDFANYVNFLYGRTPDGSGTDFRLNYWFNRNTGTNYYPFQKYKKPLHNNPPAFAIYRLSEAYYTLCEAMIGKNNIEALGYLNKVRSARGLEKLADSESNNVATYLMRERRKEFIGEGRMFFICKRLFKNIEVSESKTIVASERIFKLPIPKDEYTYGPNAQPKK